MSSRPLPDELRRLVGDDLRPVRPLAPVWQRAALVMAGTVALFSLGVVVFALRPDLDQLPAWLSWGCTLVQLAIGTSLLLLALREAIPGAAAPLGVVTTTVAAGFALQVALGFATWMVSAGPPFAAVPATKQMLCMRNDVLMALPVLAVTLWLVFRALPLRAPLAGLAGASGAALAADAVNHLRCGLSDPRHVLLWHTGAIVLCAAAGWLLGAGWRRLRWGGRRA